MKSYLSPVLILLILAASCSQPKLTKEIAAGQIIAQEYTPPRYYELKIYCADPSFAAKVMNAGLEKDGLVTIQKTYKGSELGKRLVSFTEKGSSFKRPTAADLQKVGIQVVKVADFKFAGVTEITDPGNGQPVEVNYDQTAANVNDFSKIAPYDFRQVKHKTALFRYIKDKGYQLIKSEIRH